MCFSAPKVDVPKAPPVPSAQSDDAKARRQEQDQINQQQQGRAATILTTPLGDPNFGKNLKRTVVSGF